MRTVVARRSCIRAATRAKASSCPSSRSSAPGCCRISVRKVAPPSGSAGAASGNDTFLAPDEHPLDVEPVVDDDDVGRRAGDEAERRLADHTGRHARRRLERTGEGDAERVEIPDSFDHRQRAAGELAVRTAGDPVADLHFEAAEAVRAILKAGACHRVRDERHAARSGVPDEPGRLRREVVSVEDDLDDHVGPRECGARDTRIAVAERAHRIEEVRHGSHAGVEGGGGLRGPGVAVSERHGDAAPEQEVDEGVGSRELRRERDHADPARVKESLEQRRIRISARQGRMRAEALRGEERAFEMDAEDARAAASLTLPFAALRRAAAVSASTPASSETTATLPSPPAASIARSTSSSGAPVAAATTRRSRVRSFSFAGATPTIRFPYVLPRRIIATVEIVLRTSFCAVPALSRVEPERISGPTVISIAWSAREACVVPEAHTNAIVRAPASRAASSAPLTYGVSPLALTPRTTSAALGERALMPAAPASRSSSAAAASSGGAPTPPATTARTLPPSTRSTFGSRTASSSSSWGPRAAGRRRCCGSSPASRR